MAGHENEGSNGPAVPKDESGRQSSEQLNEVGRQHLKEGPADKDLNPANGNESSVKKEQPDDLGKRIREYARNRLGGDFPLAVEGLFTEACKGSINHFREFFRLSGVQELDKPITGPPESRSGFFSQLLNNVLAKEKVAVPRPGEVETAATREVEIVPLPGEDQEVQPHSKEAL